MPHRHFIEFVQISWSAAKKRSSVRNENSPWPSTTCHDCGSNKTMSALSLGRKLSTRRDAPQTRLQLLKPVFSSSISRNERCKNSLTSNENVSRCAQSKGCLRFQGRATSARMYLYSRIVEHAALKHGSFVKR